MTQQAKEEDTSFLEIDELSLELEWMRQPVLADKWLKKLAKARRSVTTWEAEKELVEAQLDKQIRSDPESFELEKVTENSIGTAIILAKPYQDVIKSLNKAKHAMNMIQATCTAIEHRKRALEGMVELFGQQYWSLPMAKTKEGKEAQDNLRKKAARSKRKPRRDDDE